MKFREHRGGLAESMETLIEVDGRKALGAHIRRLLKPYMDIADSDISANLYGSSGDNRIGWEKVYIVTVKGYGVIGFSDGPIESESGTVPDPPVVAAKARRPRRPSRTSSGETPRPRR